MSEAAEPAENRPHVPPSASPEGAGVVELRDSIQRSLGIDLPATVIFDYPTISALASHLTTQYNTQRTPHVQHPKLDSKPSKEAVMLTLHEIIRRLLGRDVAADQPLMEAGIDSLGLWFAK